MSIWTSAWFWILVLGIILTIVGVVIWIVQGNANVTVGILLGFGVAWIIAGLVFWIFGRSKTPPAQTKPVESTPIASTTTMQQATMPQANPYMSQQGAVQQPVQQANPYLATGTNTAQTNPYLAAGTNPYMTSTAQQQQLQQFLMNNPQYLNAYLNSTNAPKI
jgi:hypothetical protein